MNKINLTIVFLLILVVLSEIYLMYFGISITLDGVSYLWGGENIKAGIGYFQYSKYQDTLIPMTKWPPVYSSLIAFNMFIFNVESLVAAKIINFFFGFLFYVIWFYFFFLHFKDNFSESKKRRQYALLISLIWLVLGLNVWQFVPKTATDLVFITFIGFVGIFFHLSIISENIKKQLLFAFLAGLFSTLAVLTRMVGLAFIIATFIAYLFFLKPIKKINFYRVILYITTSLSGLFLWFWRNSFYPDKNHVASRLTGKLDKLFNLDKIVDILNYFVLDTLNVSSRLETYALIFLLPILIIIVFIVVKQWKTTTNKFLTPSNIWLLLSLFLYVSMITYSGVTGGHNRSSGFMRYFFAVQAFVIPILISLILVLSNYKNRNYKIALLFFILFSFYSFLSGLNKNRVYFTSLEKKELNTELYIQISKKVKNNDLLLSTSNKLIRFHSKRQCLYVEHPDRIRLLLTDWWKTPYKNVFLVLNKGIGTSFKKGFLTWKEIVPQLPHKSIIYENDNYIFIELDKEAIFKEAEK